MATLQVENHLQEWRHRRPWLDPAISTDTTMCRLHRGATMDSPSLALIRPRLVTGLKIDRHPGWTPQQRAKIEQYVGQFDLFGNTDRSALEAPRYSGSYRYLCHDDTCPGHRQGILDWESSSRCSATSATATTAPRVRR
jgi:hypothetical protein